MSGGVLSCIPFSSAGCLSFSQSSSIERIFVVGLRHKEHPRRTPCDVVISTFVIFKMLSLAGH